MNIKSNLKWVLILLSILNPSFVHSQNKCTEKEYFYSSVVDLKLPCRYKKKILNYEEGKFVDYYYPDSSIITLFSGTMQKLPLLSKDMEYFPQYVDSLPGRIVTVGVKDGKHWREDVIGEIRILYDRVPSKKKAEYDSVLNSIHINKE